jgi:hypothetical protein
LQRWAPRDKTPTRQSAPPRKASSTGVSPSIAQPSRIASPPGPDVSLGGRETNDDRAGEADRTADDQRSRKALTEQKAGEERDQHGADVDEHRRRAGV